MPTSSTRQDDDSLADEQLQRQARVAIERMVREGRTEKAIVRELSAILDPAPPRRGSRTLFGRFRDAA
jgi:hypothetical protein